MSIKIRRSEMVNHITEILFKDLMWQKTAEEFEIYSVKNRQVRLADLVTLRRDVRRETLAQYDMSARGGEDIYKQALDAITSQTSRHIKGTIKPVGFYGDDDYSFVRFQKHTTPIELDTLPEFNIFLNQATEEGRRAIIMWVGSLVDGKSNRKQYLHLFGEGNEGKSALIQVIDKALDGQSTLLTARRLQGNHFGGELIGKRLYAFPDENNNNFFSSGAFKALTGEATLDYNEKQKAVRRIQLTGKVLVCSNSAVEICDKEADRSRLISVELTNAVKPANWQPQFVASATKVLMYCYQQYQTELAKNPGLRKKLPNVESAIAAAIERKFEIIEDAATLCLEFNPKRFEKRADVMKVMLERLQGQGKPKELRTQIAQYLSSKGVTLRRDKELGWVFEGVILIND